MFILLLLPPICGLCLFLGLLTAARGPLVRLVLTLVLSGLVVPILGVATHRFLHELPLDFVFLGTALLVASLIWRLIPVLPVPRTNVRGLCWGLVLVSCTLTTVVLTAPAPVAHGLELALLLRLVVVGMGVVGAHTVVTLLNHRFLVPVKPMPRSGSTTGQGQQPTKATPTLLNRPLELAGASGPYRPLTHSLAAGAGPAAAFSAN